MTRIAPSEISNFSDPSLFKQYGANEWHGPCKRCGGQDRFVLFTDHPYPNWNWFCRQCHPDSAWLSELDSRLAQSLDPALVEQWRRDREEKERQRAEYRKQKLAEFSTKEIWREFCDRMQEQHRQWWRSNGIPDDWQNYLRLGHIDQKPFRDDNDVLCVSPAYTIPFFHFNRECKHCDFITMQYRLETDKTDQRYRFETGLGSSWYDTTPTKPINDKVIICEGAKKAICTKVRLAPEDHTVLAVPSKSDWSGIAEKVSECGIVWIVLDPDAAKEAKALKAEIGRSARVIELPEKIDDAIVRHGLDRKTWASITKFAIRI